MKQSKILLPMLAMLAGTCAGNAAVFIHEGFNYALADGANMDGVAATATGLTGNYAVGGSTASGVWSAAGLTFGATFPVSGGAVRLSAATGGSNNSLLGAAIGLPARTGTLWSSYLVNFTSKATTGNPTAQVRVSDAQTAGGNNRFNSLADNFGGLNTGISYSGTTTTTTGGATLATGTTYLMLSRYTNVGTAGGGTATLWIFDLAGYESWLGAGSGLEANLGTYSLGSQSHTSTTQADFGPGGFHQLAISNANGSTAEQAVVYDELRWGTSLGDVVPFDAFAGESGPDGLTPGQRLILGLDPGIPHTALADAIRANPEFLGLFRREQLFDQPGAFVMEAPASGPVPFAFRIRGSIDLEEWTTLQTIARPTVLPDGKSFFRVTFGNR